MVERVYPTASNLVTLICPECKKAKTADVSQFINKSRTVKIKSTCTCGHQWVSILEKRRQYRKSVNLAGTFDLIRNEKVVDRGGMTVMDISFNGVKMKMNVDRNLQVGDHLNIEFTLDDDRHTLMKKRVTIRNKNGLFVGATFRTADPYDPVLGFYLMPEKPNGQDRREFPNRRENGDISYEGSEKRESSERRSFAERRKAN
ncbi:MAG: PilZ domain-containing protein [Deltaproteobacteria bacterium]